MNNFHYTYTYICAEVVVDRIEWALPSYFVITESQPNKPKSWNEKRVCRMKKRLFVNVKSTPNRPIPVVLLYHIQIYIYIANAPARAPPTDCYFTTNYATQFEFNYIHSLTCIRRVWGNISTALRILPSYWRGGKWGGMAFNCFCVCHFRGTKKK